MGALIDLEQEAEKIVPGKEAEETQEVRDYCEGFSRQRYSKEELGWKWNVVSSGKPEDGFSSHQSWQTLCGDRQDQRLVVAQAVTDEAEQTAPMDRITKTAAKTP